MKGLRHILAAELLKWTRSWPLLIAILAPALQAFFLCVWFWFSEDRFGQFDSGFTAWYKINTSTWCLFFMPITIALVSTISWEQEEDANAWKHLLLQPLPKGHHYWAKLISHGMLLLISQGVLTILLLLLGLLLRRQVPLLQMGASIPSMLLAHAAAAAAAMVPLVGFHTWMGHRFSGLGTALLVTLAGAWTTFQFFDASPLMCLSPWGMTSLVSRWVRDNEELQTYAFAASLFVLAAFTALGLFQFLRKKRTNA